MTSRAVCLGCIVVGAVSQLIQLVVAGSAVAQIVYVVVCPASVTVADLRALWTGSDECLGYEGVDGAHSVLALVGEMHARIPGFLHNGRAQNLALEVADLAVGVIDSAVNAAYPPVATNFINSLIPVDGFPSFTCML